MDGDHRPNRKKHAADESLESLHRVDPHVIGALEAASLHHPAHSSSRRSRNSTQRSRPAAPEISASASATRRKWSRSRSISPAPPPTSTSGRDIHTGTLDDEWQGADCLTCQDGTTTRKVQLTARVVISKQYQGKDLCLSRDAESAYIAWGEFMDTDDSFVTVRPTEGTSQIGVFRTFTIGADI